MSSLAGQTLKPDVLMELAQKLLLISEKSRFGRRYPTPGLRLSIVVALLEQYLF